MQFIGARSLTQQHKKDSKSSAMREMLTHVSYKEILCIVANQRLGWLKTINLTSTLVRTYSYSSGVTPIGTGLCLVL